MPGPPKWQPNLAFDPMTLHDLAHYVSERERERDIQRQRQRETETDRQTHTHTGYTKADFSCIKPFNLVRSWSQQITYDFCYLDGIVLYYKVPHIKVNNS